MNNKSMRFAVLIGMAYLAGMGFIIWFLNSRDIGTISEGQMWIPSYVMFTVTLICAGLMPRIPMIIWPAAVFGIGFGVVLNAFTDGQDHNLFPFEVILWAGIVTPGSLLGATAGTMIYWLRNKIERNRRLQPTPPGHDVL